MALASASWLVQGKLEWYPHLAIDLPRLREGIQGFLCLRLLDPKLC